MNASWLAFSKSRYFASAPFWWIVISFDPGAAHGDDGGAASFAMFSRTEKVT
jgi:hypothetical protein